MTRKISHNFSRRCPGIPYLSRHFPGLERLHARTWLPLWNQSTEALHRCPSPPRADSKVQPSPEESRRRGCSLAGPPLYRAHCPPLSWPCLCSLTPLRTALITRDYHDQLPGSPDIPLAFGSRKRRQIPGAARALPPPSQTAVNTSISFPLCAHRITSTTLCFSKLAYPGLHRPSCPHPHKQDPSTTRAGFIAHPFSLALTSLHH